MNITNITEEKNKLKAYIDDLSISEETYKYIVPLLNVDDSLFTKIIEEIKNGNLKFNDFYRIFDDIPNYTNTIERSIDEQEKLFNEFNNLYNKLNDLNAETVDLRLKNLGAIIEFITDDGKTISATDIEKQNILFSLFAEDINDPFKNYYKSLMLDEIVKNLENDNNEAVNNMLLSLHDYLLPIDFNHIILNDTDREFMKANNIKYDDEMKKIKSLAGFAAVHFK